MKLLARFVPPLFVVLLAAPALPVAAQNHGTESLMCCSREEGGELKFFAAPRSRCTKDRLADPERCEGKTDGPRCCKGVNGYVWLPASQCRLPTGTPAEPRHCREEGQKVCCRYKHPRFGMNVRKLNAKRCEELKGRELHKAKCLSGTGFWDLR